MTVSLMDSNTTEYEELSKDPEKLLQHLSDRIEEISLTLDDDEDFCNKDIDASIKYVETIEKKFNEKIQELKGKLEQIRIENQKTSEQNKNQFSEQMETINELFTSGKHDEAWKKFKDYEKKFEQRPTAIRNIPKLHMNEMDVEQYFSSDYKSTKSSPTPSTIVISSTVTTNDDKYDPIDDNQLTKKEILRRKKIIETVHIDKDNEELNDEKTEQNVDDSQFGIRSKRAENQQTTINGTITNDTKSPTTTTTVPSHPVYRISTRLEKLSKNNNLPFSGRNISASSLVQNNHQNPRINHEQIRSTTTPPNSTYSSSPPHINKLIQNPVIHYQHERNIFLLMTCSTKYIVLFKSQRNRLDRWHLGAIERGSHNEHSLDWHDGLIISMGYIGNNQIYMFTEREFFIYSLLDRRKLNTRILPHGNDDGFEINNSSSNQYQRGIGTVFNKFMYHIYLNRKSRWTLSKNSLEKLVHIYDYDLTRLFPDVLSFIHLCVNEKRINFLVQMNDLSYAVVFCSTNDRTINECISQIILSGAKQPLTIYSGFMQSLKQEVFFINDPSNDILHILTIENYLQSYSITAHAICYVEDKNELMIVTNNSISSINLNEQNLVFS